MDTSRKIQKDKDVEPTELEESVAQALFDLEDTNQDLKSDLNGLYINSATQIDESNCKAVVIRYPFRLRRRFRKIHLKLVRELEKQFSGNVVVLIPTRRMSPPPPHTMAVVHDAILKDIVHPAECVGRYVEYRRNDGSIFNKFYLNSKARNDTEHKLEAFAGVFRKLCGQHVVFEYTITEA